ncbi:MAG: hypothetical protein ACTSU4_02495 [Promethearchaeota archaeon]
MVDPVFIGMVYELIIIIIGALLVILILNRYFVKRHVLTLYLVFIFLFMLISIVFSWLSKIIVLTTELDYVYNEPIPNVNPDVPFPWLLTRIVDFRISIFFVALGVFLSYILRVKVFEKGYNSLERAIIIIFGIYTLFFTLFIYVRGNTLLDAINFFNILLYMFMVYLPFTINSLKAYKAVEEPGFKRAFASLAFMSVSFILVLINVLIDRITILLGSSGFTAFYFAAWAFVIIGFTGAYLGYIRPSSPKKS